MKKNLKFIIALILICICIFCGVKYSKANNKINGKITQVFAFGDSYSDNGQAKRISTEIMASPSKPNEAYLKPSDELYWKNRYSNGNTAVEILAKKLDVTLTDYATGGATTGENNYSPWMDYLGNTGVLGQLEKFKKSLNGNQADPDALYFIFASGNDYFLFMDYSLPGTVESVADKSVDNINIAVKSLAKLGAKKFFVVNSSDLSLVPYEIVNNRTKAAKAFVERVNTTLPKAMKDIPANSNLSITVFDLPKISDNIIKNPGKYGLVELSKECESTYPKVKPAHANPDQYYFWDEWHYTSATHKIFGEAMYDKVRESK